MTIFINFSHKDIAFATRLVNQLSFHNVQGCIEAWEAADSDQLIEKVKNSETGTKIILFILSKASMASDWFSQKLTEKLLCELEEKAAIVFPVIIEDVAVPELAGGRLYMDCRTDLGRGLYSVAKEVANISKLSQHSFSLQH